MISGIFFETHHGAWILLVSLILLSHRAVPAGEVITHTIESERLSGNLVGESPTKEVLVYLPDGYDESQERYPVVYWFPGARQTSTWQIELDRIDEEFVSGRSQPSIIVFMPSKTSFESTTYLSSEVFGDWEGFLQTEVIPLVDTKYRTVPAAEQRGIMGFSLGGFTALTLPLLMPNTFGAVGANDPGIPFISGMVRDRSDYPEGYVPEPDPPTLEEFFGYFPETVEGFKETPVIYSGYGQIAARLSPNPEHPLGGDLPFDRSGAWIPEAREKWRAFDLLDPESVALHREALESLRTLTILYPEERVNNTPWSEEMVEVSQAAGMAAQGIYFPGDHNDFQYERFTTLLSNVSYALKGENRTSLQGSTYRQNFDQLGTDDQRGADLPAGWSVTDGFGFVFKDRTNTAFHSGELEQVGPEPYILNVGHLKDEDRALAIYLPADSQGATIQLLADLSNTQANALELQFDLEVWDLVTVGDDGILGEVSFQVTAQLDFGEGFQQAIDLGSVTTGRSLLPPAGELLDGNDALNRVIFASDLIAAPLGDAEAIRIQWTTAMDATTPEWVFGIDNVQLAFHLLGDFDGDADLTANDIDLLSTAVRSANGDPRFDLNTDGKIDDADRQRLVMELAGTVFGDANLDRNVDFFDLLLLSRSFGRPVGWAFGDFDGSGTSDFPDFLLLADNFGVTAARASAVPEPGSLLPFGLAMLLILRRCRRDVRR